MENKNKKAKTKITGNELEVTLPAGLPGEIQPIKQMFIAIVTKNVKGIEKVKFVEEFEKPKEEAEIKQTSEKSENSREEKKSKSSPKTKK